MDPDDVFRSIREHARSELKVKGSRFIAEAFPVASEDEAAAHIDEVRRREHAATHHCTAYRIGPSGEIFRHNDDGEPSGTAGAPILRQIEGRDLTNALVVVTRYFGGTKLGTGGLARAYSDAASDVLDRIKLIEHVISERVNVSFSYEDTAAAMLTIERLGAKVVGSEYGARTELSLDVPRSRVEAFEDAFADALGGRGTLER